MPEQRETVEQQRQRWRTVAQAAVTPGSGAFTSEHTLAHAVLALLDEPQVQECPGAGYPNKWDWHVCEALGGAIRRYPALLCSGGCPASADFDPLERLEVAAEVDEVYRRVINEECPTDEVHCTCVPFLRMEIERLNKARAGDRAAVRELIAAGSDLFVRPCLTTAEQNRGALRWDTACAEALKEQPEPGANHVADEEG